MPESELFKIALQGGMFGLWVVFIIWLLFYGAPMFKGTLEKMSEDNRVAQERLSEDHKQAMLKVSEDNRIAAVTMAEEFRKMLREKDKEALQERRELIASANAEREEERKSRHAIANAIQELVAMVSEKKIVKPVSSS